MATPASPSAAGIDSRRLAIYLNDHLAGATAGLELAKRCRDHAEGAGARAELDAVAREVGEDRETLLGLMRELGVRPDPLRQSLAWLGEKATRVRLGNPVTAGPQLGRLLELEALALGVEGKRSLWEALRRSLAGSPAITGVPLSELVARAVRQREVLERHRLAAADAAFGRAAGGPGAEPGFGPTQRGADPGSATS